MDNIYKLGVLFMIVCGFSSHILSGLVITALVVFCYWHYDTPIDIEGGK